MKKTNWKKIEYERPDLLDIMKRAARGAQGCEDGSANDFVCDNGQAAIGLGCINGVGATGKK